MTLTIGQIHDLYVAISTLERDEKIKLVPDVRLKLAINHNLLQPIANGYERTRTRALADLNKVNRVLDSKAQRSDAELQADFADQNEALRVKTEELALKRLTRPDLKLDENETLGAAMLARLLPIVDGLETAAEPAQAPAAG